MMQLVQEIEMVEGREEKGVVVGEVQLPEAAVSMVGIIMWAPTVVVTISWEPLLNLFTI
jgi:hypothetical protein